MYSSTLTKPICITQQPPPAIFGNRGYNFGIEDEMIKFKHE
jgi:hypothetical protein